MGGKSENKICIFTAQLWVNTQNPNFTSYLFLLHQGQDAECESSHLSPWHAFHSLPVKQAPPFPPRRLCGWANCASPTLFWVTDTMSLRSSLLQSTLKHNAGIFSPDSHSQCICSSRLENDRMRQARFSCSIGFCSNLIKTFSNSLKSLANCTDPLK